MKELKQTHVNYITLFNTLVILGVIVFFLRKWKEMTERETERDKKLEQLQKSLKDGTDHNKAVLGRINKKLTEISIPNSHQQRVHFHPPSIEEEIIPDENDDISDTLSSLMA